MKTPKIVCTECDLHKYRRNIVIGRGSMPADILFIGEGPGRSEDLRGEAFIGQAGKVLNTLLDAVGITSYYITNTVLCHPTDSFNGDNRVPSQHEVLTCSKNIMRIVKLVNPKMTVLLGKVAEKYYGNEFPDAIRLQHPSFLARQGGESSPYYQVNLQALKEAFDENFKEEK